MPICVFKQIYLCTYHDVRIAFKSLYEMLIGPGFLLIGISFFPMALGNNQELLLSIYPAVIWILALLSCIIALESLIQKDIADGTLIALQNESMSGWAYALSKTLSHWLINALPVCVIAPILAIMLQAPFEQLHILIIALVLGTASISLQGVMMMMMTLGAQRINGLLLVLMLPFAVPIVIFGTGVLRQEGPNNLVSMHLALLGAYFFFLLILCPFLAGLSLRNKHL